MPGTSSYVSNCAFRGGGHTKQSTQGIFLNKANSLIENSQFQQFMDGGIIANLNPDNLLVFNNNSVFTC